jgi:hypothetical protein
MSCFDHQVSPSLFCLPLRNCNHCHQGCRIKNKKTLSLYSKYFFIKYLQTVLCIDRYCGIRDPSWSELKHFVDFLNSQVKDCEKSIYCKAENVDDKWMQGTLKGFKSFVVRFMVTMSRV